ncbi:MAG: hypothetical protein FJ161_02725 [Gammaproteobacteria bacterium]|nr:hypothetical protein [Gammaproteobacteria bacterium]
MNNKSEGTLRANSELPQEVIALNDFLSIMWELACDSEKKLYAPVDGPDEEDSEVAELDAQTEPEFELASEIFLSVKRYTIDMISLRSSNNPIQMTEESTAAYKKNQKIDVLAEKTPIEFLKILFSRNEYFCANQDSKFCSVASLIENSIQDHEKFIIAQERYKTLTQIVRSKYQSKKIEKQSFHQMRGAILNCSFQGYDESHSEFPLLQYAYQLFNTVQTEKQLPEIIESINTLLKSIKTDVNYFARERAYAECILMLRTALHCTLALYLQKEENNILYRNLRRMELIVLVYSAWSQLIESRYGLVTFFPKYGIDFCHPPYKIEWNFFLEALHIVCPLGNTKELLTPLQREELTDNDRDSINSCEGEDRGEAIESDSIEDELSVYKETTCTELEKEFFGYAPWLKIFNETTADVAVLLNIDMILPSTYDEFRHYFEVESRDKWMDNYSLVLCSVNLACYDTISLQNYKPRSLTPVADCVETVYIGSYQPTPEEIERDRRNARLRVESEYKKWHEEWENKSHKHIDFLRLYIEKKRYQAQNIGASCVYPNYLTNEPISLGQCMDDYYLPSLTTELFSEENKNEIIEPRRLHIEILDFFKAIYFAIVFQFLQNNQSYFTKKSSRALDLPIESAVSQQQENNQEKVTQDFKPMDENESTARRRPSH